MDTNKNVFQELNPSEKLPLGAKSQVLDRLATAKLFVDFWDLLVVNRANAVINTLAQRDFNNKTKNK